MTAGGARRAFPFGRLSVEVLGLTLAFLGYLGLARWLSTDVPGGADSWGYVSEAVRLSHGRLYEPERVLSLFGLPENAPSTQPLGYTSKGRGGTVPIYPFGYPLLMALAITLFGQQGAFWVTPLLAAGAVVLTYLLGRATLGRGGGVIAALLLAVLPNFLWGAIQPLSDVPAAFFCALVLMALLALPSGRGPDVLLGAAIGLALWVRPNMGLLFAVVSAWLVFRGEWRRIARVVLVLAPFVAVEALLNWHLFGAPWRTGYGEIPFGDPLTEVFSRGVRHLLRLNVQQGGVGLALLALALFWNRLTASRRVLLGSVFGAFLCFFAAYRFDSAWWYLRFLVPAIPAVVVLEAGFLVRLAEKGRWLRLRRTVVVLATCALVFGEWRYGQAKNLYTLKGEERRYANVGRLAAGFVEMPAVVLAMQHSGSLRYFAGLPTARYDMNTPQALISTLLRVSQAGGRVYLVADDWELERIANGGRGFLLTGATLLGHATPGYTAVYLLDVEKAAERLRRGAASRRRAGEGVVFGGRWDRSGPTWRIAGTGTVRLPDGEDPALARFCAFSAALVVHRPGFPDSRIAAGSCADVPLLPGRSGTLEVAPSGRESATLPAVEVLALGALRSSDLLATSYMVPQVARLAGEKGSFWQTDLVLVNPQRHALPVTGLFLRSGRDNRQAYAVTAALAAGATMRLRDVLKVPGFEWLGGRGALLVYAGEPRNPCSDPSCRFLLCARTYDAVATTAAPDGGEWLPGLPADAALTAGRASFAHVLGSESGRASVGLASWSERPLRVRIHTPGAPGGPGVARDAVVPPFGHERVDLGGWASEGAIEVELITPVSDARLFPYVSVVDGATGAVRHLLPDAVSTRKLIGPPPLPRPLSAELRRDL